MTILEESKMLMLTLLGLVACGEDEKEENEENEENEEIAYPYCEETETPHAADEETLFGFKMEDFIASMPISNTVGFEWLDGSFSCLTGTVSFDSTTVRSVPSTAVYPESDEPTPSIGIACDDYVAIDGTISFSTDDDQISEEHSVTFKFSEYEISEPLIARYSLEVSALSGSLDPSNGDASARFFIEGKISSAEFVGSLSMQTSGEDGEVAWAQNEEIGTWGEPAPEGCGND